MTAPQINLATPLTLPCGVTVPNRLLKSAMTEGLASPMGHATPEHARLYQRWAEGGAGILLTGNVMVDRRFLERPGNVIVDGVEDKDALARWAEAVHAGGSQLWMQISHPGRQCSRAVTAHPMAPSAVQLKLLGYFGKPRAMSEADIRAAIAAYAYTAGVAKDSGFDGVQVHAAHGYLISQFLSPVTNRRDDRWGGSLENRARFLLEVVAAVRERVGAGFPIAVKLNSADFQKGGFTLEECGQVVEWLAAAGIDLLEISGGTYEQMKLFDRSGKADDAVQPQRESTRRREAYFLDYAKAIRPHLGSVPLVVTGGFRAADLMREALGAGELDMVGLARPLCTDPDLARKLINGEVERADSYEDRLALGPGFFAPNSPNATIKAINASGMVAFFYRQILAMARGQELPLGLSLLQSLLLHYRDEFRLARARRKSPLLTMPR